MKHATKAPDDGVCVRTLVPGHRVPERATGERGLASRAHTANVAAALALIVGVGAHAGEATPPSCAALSTAPTLTLSVPEGNPVPENRNPHVVVKASSSEECRALLKVETVDGTATKGKGNDFLGFERTVPSGEFGPVPDTYTIHMTLVYDGKDEGVEAFKVKASLLNPSDSAVITTEEIEIQIGNVKPQSREEGQQPPPVPPPTEPEQLGDDDEEDETDPEYVTYRYDETPAIAAEAGQYAIGYRVDGETRRLFNLSSSALERFTSKWFALVLEDADGQALPCPIEGLHDAGHDVSLVWEEHLTLFGSTPASLAARVETTRLSANGKRCVFEVSTWLQDGAEGDFRDYDLTVSFPAGVIPEDEDQP